MPQLDFDAADAECDERSEHRVVRDADDRLDPAADHRLDEHAVEVIASAVPARGSHDVAR